MIQVKPYEHKVNYYETDKMQITHHSNYIRFMEESRVSFLEQIGWGYDKMEEEGIISPVISVNVNYKKTTTFPNVITIYVGVEKVTPTKLSICYEMKVGESVVCTASSSHCFLSSEGRPLIIEKAYPDFYKVLKELESQNNPQA